MSYADQPAQSAPHLSLTGPTWRRASFCASGECLEASQQGGLVVLRSSTDPGGCELRCTIEEWQSFVRGIKSGEFDDLGLGS
jgi:hypothetical protein